MTRFIKKSMYLVILMSRFRPAMMHLVQSYDDRDNGTEGVHVNNNNWPDSITREQQLAFKKKI